MNHIQLILTIFLVACLFTSVHAQEAIRETTPAPGTSAGQTTIDSQKDSPSAGASEIAITAPAPEGGRVHAQKKSRAAMTDVTIHTKKQIVCVTDVATGVTTCPAPAEPCLVSDPESCNPPANPETVETPSESGTPLFSFNQLWVPGKVVPSNPNTGTLVETPTVPIELTETGPSPSIIAKADGRTTLLEEEKPASSGLTNSITGLFSSANLPWLGLLVLLMVGIIAWRKRNE